MSGIYHIIQGQIKRNTVSSTFKEMHNAFYDEISIVQQSKFGESFMSASSILNHRRSTC